MDRSEGLKHWKPEEKKETRFKCSRCGKLITDECEHWTGLKERLAMVESFGPRIHAPIGEERTEQSDGWIEHKRKIEVSDA